MNGFPQFNPWLGIFLTGAVFGAGWWVANRLLNGLMALMGR